MFSTVLISSTVILDKQQQLWYFYILVVLILNTFVSGPERYGPKFFAGPVHCKNYRERTRRCGIRFVFSLMSGSEKSSLATPVSFPGVVGGYRWRELPQVSFLSRQKHVFCPGKSNRDKRRIMSRKTRVCHDKSKRFRRQNICCDTIMFVATNITLYFCRNQTFVASNILLSCLSRQK